MELPVVVRRAGYRVAYRLLQVVWLIARPRLRGVKCLLTDGQLVLLVRHTYGPRRWDIPGGRIRAREAPLECARREMAEELGLEDVGWSETARIAVFIRGRRDFVNVVRAELAAPQLRLDPGELAEARWFPRDGLPPDLAPWARSIIARFADAPAA